MAALELNEILSGLVLELRRGTLVLCVLGKLKKPIYGYNLIQRLTEFGITIEANTLYPLLRRLESQGLFQSVWETSGSKPRKYYSTTPLGDAVYVKLKAQWDETVDRIRKLLEEKQ